MMSAEIAKWPSDEILARFVAEEVPCAPILSRQALLDNKQVVENAIIEIHDDPVLGHEFGHFALDVYSDDNSPGGQHFVNAATTRDEFLLLGVSLFFGFLIVVMNLLADILTGFLDPRVRIAGNAD